MSDETNVQNASRDDLRNWIVVGSAALVDAETEFEMAQAHRDQTRGRLRSMIIELESRPLLEE